MRLGMVVLAGLAAMIVAASAGATQTGVTIGTGPASTLLGSYFMGHFRPDPQPAGGAPVTSIAIPLGGMIGLPPGTTHSRIGAG